MQAVEQEQGASAGPSSKTRRCVHGMRQPMSTISNLPVDYDYIFLTSFPQAFETWMRVQSSKFIPERWTMMNISMSFVFQTTVRRIWNRILFERIFEYSCIHSGCLLYQARTKQVRRLDTLYPLLNGFECQPSLCSIDSNTNLVCLAHCLSIILLFFHTDISLEHSDFASGKYKNE
jgi:hypothetical protein